MKRDIGGEAIRQLIESETERGGITAMEVVEKTRLSKQRVYQWLKRNEHRTVKLGKDDVGAWKFGLIANAAEELGFGDGAGVGGGIGSGRAVRPGQRYVVTEIVGYENGRLAVVMETEDGKSRLLGAFSVS